MKQYLLDTDVCIELIKHNERVLDKVEAVGADNCFVTDITIAELFYGAAKSGHAGHFDDVDNIIQSFDLYLQTKYNMQTARKDSSLFDMLKRIRKIAAVF